MKHTMSDKVKEPTVALSVRQPWAWLITHPEFGSVKDIENRTWATNFRGPVWIHASKGMTKAEWCDAYAFVADSIPPGPGPASFLEIPLFDDPCYQRGGIIGKAEIVDCVTRSSSPWFVGPYGFVLRNAEPVPFRPCKGSLGFFRPDISKPITAEEAAASILASGRTGLFL